MEWVPRSSIPPVSSVRGAEILNTYIFIEIYRFLPDKKSPSPDKEGDYGGEGCQKSHVMLYEMDYSAGAGDSSTVAAG